MGVSTAELTEAISTLGVVGSDVTVDTTSGWVFRTSDCWAYGQINTALLGIFTRDHQDDPAALRGLAAFGGALGIAAGAELAAASGDVATAAIGAVLVAGGSETTAAIFGAVLGGFTLGLGVAGIAVGAYVLYKVEAGN